MHLSEGEYEKAHTDFFEAFKNYDESGSPRYVLLVFYGLARISISTHCLPWIILFADAMF